MSNTAAHAQPLNCVDIPAAEGATRFLVFQELIFFFKFKMQSGEGEA
jgi:hypothetical protein